MRATLVLLASVSVLGGAGCTARLQGQTMQPNPLAVPASDMLRQSARVKIRVRDMEVPRTFQIYDSAYFSVVSRDRLRFHVELFHKWEEMVDVSGWRARLEDDRGRVFRPVDPEATRGRHTGRLWDTEQRTATRDLFGDPVRLRSDAHLRRTTLSKLDLYRGRGDLVFAAPELMSRRVTRLTLVLERGGVELRFTWHLFDPADGVDEEGGEAGDGDPVARGE